MTKDEALKLAMEALEHACGDRCNAEYNPCFQREAITAINEALAQPEQQAKMRMPKVGDKVICLEDESLGEVVSLTAGGSPDIKFDDGSRGTYLLREFAELFGYVTSPQQQAEPIAFYSPTKGFSWAKPTSIFAPTIVDVPPMPLYTSPPQRPWVGLEIEEVQDSYNSDYQAQTRAVEKLLKERNT